MPLFSSNMVTFLKKIFNTRTRKKCIIPINSGKSLECTPEVPSNEGEAVLEKTVRLYSLTPRETDIFRLLAKRESAEEIAESLVVSVATVRTHIRNIYAKMDVHSAKEFHALVEEACAAGESETQQE